MTNIHTLIDLLRLRADQEPRNCAYRFLQAGEAEEGNLTYSELEARARAIAAWLQARVRPADRVLLLLPPGLDYITAFFGCLFAGAIAVPAYPPKRRSNRGEGRIEAIIRDASPAMILTASTIASKIPPNDAATNPFAGMPWQEVEKISSALAGEWRVPAVARETTAFIQYTSGSTSLPKGVMVSHANLLENQRMIQQVCGHDSASTFVGWLPLYHDMGLVGNMLQPLFIGARCILMSPAAFIQKPVRWLRAISTYRAHTSGGPNFAYDLCVRKISHEEREGLDLSSWTVAFNGAEPVRQETLTRFAEEFRPHGFRATALSPCYGLAEASLIVSCKRRLALPSTVHIDARAAERGSVEEQASANRFTLTMVGCGPPVIDTDILIVDPQTRMICPPGGIGEVWIHGSGVAQGYWNRPQDTQETFGARLATEDRRTFLRTGDLGFIRNGELFVTGRLKDVIIIRGMNHCAEDIEWSVQQCSAAILSVAAFPVSEQGEERLVIAVELHPAAESRIDEITSLIRQTVSERHEAQAHAIVFVKAGGIPRTSSGKVQRKLCRKQYRAAELELAFGESSGIAVARRDGNAGLGVSPPPEPMLPIA
jgi:acyl-CoA synthetase (AMP-forming)/AMP-acid ligase II